MAELPELFAAAGAGDLVALRRLLEAGAPPDQVLDPSLLDEAVKYALVQGGSGYEYAHYEVGSPLTLAIASGQSDAARLLLEGGAATGMFPPYQSMPPLLIAVMEGNLEIARELLARGASPNAGFEISVLYAASSMGAEDMVRLLLEGGADINGSGNEFGETALHAAARRGNRAMIELLLRSGAARDAWSDQGTPADVARSAGFGEIAVLLEDGRG